MEELRRIVPTLPAGRVVAVGDWGLALDDYLVTRLLELVVHMDDLAVSLGTPTPGLPAAATDTKITLLARIAAWRHGPLAVTRALARAERAHGSVAAF